MNSFLFPRLFVRFIRIPPFLLCVCFEKSFDRVFPAGGVVLAEVSFSLPPSMVEAVKSEIQGNENNYKCNNLVSPIMKCIKKKELLQSGNLLLYGPHPFRFGGIHDSKAATAHKFDHVVDPKFLWLVFSVWLESKNVCGGAKNKDSLKKDNIVVK